MLPLCGSKLQLRFPVARDHAVTHTFSYLSMPLQATNWLPIICGWLRRAFFKACPPAVCTIARPDLPAYLGTPVDLRSTSIRGRGFAAYLPGCARQLFNVRCAHYARGALLTNQSSPVPAAARPPEGHWRAHSAAAPCRPPHVPRRGIGVRPRQRHLAAYAPELGTSRCSITVFRMSSPW